MEYKEAHSNGKVTTIQETACPHCGHRSEDLDKFEYGSWAYLQCKCGAVFRGKNICMQFVELLRPPLTEEETD